MYACIDAFDERLLRFFRYLLFVNSTINCSFILCYVYLFPCMKDGLENPVRGAVIVFVCFLSLSLSTGEQLISGIPKHGIFFCFYYVLVLISEEEEEKERKCVSMHVIALRIFF